MVVLPTWQRSKVPSHSKVTNLAIIMIIITGTIMVIMIMTVMTMIIMAVMTMAVMIMLKMPITKD